MHPTVGTRKRAVSGEEVPGVHADRAVTALSSVDGWAVGDINSVTGEAEVLHFDGNVWQPVSGGMLLFTWQGLCPTSGERLHLSG